MPWVSKAEKRADSFTGSFVSHVEPKRGSMLNPKLLEMVIKTINKRPTIAGEFQRGLAKTAAQTWNTHLAERKKMTKKQKVVEEIASNLGLAKGFRTEIQDEAERLVSILFKEIGKKKPKEEEESTDESSESVEEETDDTSIESIKDIPEPVKPPPKPPVVKKIVAPKVFPHIIPRTPLTIRKKSEPAPVVKEEVKTLPATPKLGLSFINVTELKVRGSSLSKDERTEQSKIAPRTYVEIARRVSESKPVIQMKKIRERKPSRSKDRAFKTQDLQSFKKRIDNSLRVRVDPKIRHPSTLWKYLEVKGFEEAKGYGSGHKYSPPNLSRLRDAAWRKAWGRDADLFQDKKSSSSLLGRTSDRPSGRSRPSRRRQGESVDDQFDERTKQYVIQQIKEMLSMLTYGKKNPEVELAKQRRRHRKSIFVLWKNYFDIRNMESLNDKRTIGFKKIQREEMLKEVDIELVKTGIYGKLAALLGEKSAKSPYEQALWNYLNERANALHDEKERLYDKALDYNISILEDQLESCQTPEDVIREQERRQKAVDNYMALLNPPKEKYCAKRPNTKETTMEEILIMRGFRGPPKNSKNTIWIKRPDFIGFLKPLKRKPKVVYDPSKLKLSKRGAGDVSTDATTKTIESSSETESSPYLVSIKRAPLTAEEKLASMRPPEVTKKRLGSFAKQERGFIKYFGSLD